MTIQWLYICSMSQGNEAAAEKETMKTIYSGSQTSKAIKSELKKAFPKQKFSVRYDSFSGGDSVSIRWELGPTSAQVDVIVNKYQYGSFDGMTDSYENDHTLVSLEGGEVARLGGVKYVQTSRDIPAEVKHHAAIEICQLENVAPVVNPRGHVWDTKVNGDYIENLVHKAFYYADFYGKEYAGIGYNFNREPGTGRFDAAPMVPGCQPSPLATVGA